MTRIERKNKKIDYTTFEVGKNINLLDFFDNSLLNILRVTQKEYDNFLENLKDEEYDLIVNLIEKEDFSSKRKLLVFINEKIK